MVQTLLRNHEVAERLGVAVKTIDQWRSRGGGPPFVRIGGVVRYRESDLERFVAERVRLSTSDDGRAAVA